MGARAPEPPLYRWWTDDCPYCESSLPALERLRNDYANDGLRVVAVYHPKPPRAVDDAEIAQAAAKRGFHGTLAIDQDWSVLKSFYLGIGRRPATSASFLLDAAGIIRFVHPGPDFFPSDDPDFARQNEDFQSLNAAIRHLVGGDAGG